MSALNKLLSIGKKSIWGNFTLPFEFGSYNSIWVALEIAYDCC